jgi:hypothetical protein
LLEAVLGILLHALELHLELLVAILKLLDGAGELAQRAFHAIEADRYIAGVRLRHTALRLWLRLWLRRCARLSRRLAAAEKIIEETAGTLLLRRSGAGEKQRKRGASRERKRQW